MPFNCLSHVHCQGSGEGPAEAKAGCCQIWDTQRILEKHGKAIYFIFPLIFETPKKTSITKQDDAEGKQKRVNEKMVFSGRACIQTRWEQFFSGRSQHVHGFCNGGFAAPLLYGAQTMPSLRYIYGYLRYLRPLSLLKCFLNSIVKYLYFSCCWLFGTLDSSNKSGTWLISLRAFPISSHVLRLVQSAARRRLGVSIKCGLLQKDCLNFIATFFGDMRILSNITESPRVILQYQITLLCSYLMAFGKIFNLMTGHCLLRNRSVPARLPKQQGNGETGQVRWLCTA